MVLEVSWAQVEEDSETLAAWLREGPEIKGLIAIARGGLIPTALLARSLDMRRIETIAVASYEGHNSGKPQVLKLAQVEDQGEGWVIVDDLVDRGGTARFVRALLPKARFVCLYSKPAGHAESDHVVRQFAQDVWLRFPWETPE